MNARLFVNHFINRRMTRTGAAARPTVEDQTDTFIDWTREHTRELSFAALAIATIAAAAWLYGRSAETKASMAMMALGQAERTLAAGRVADGQAELERLVVRYEGTAAGTQGALRLAQVLYEQGKFQEGVTHLEQTLDEYGSGPLEVSIRQLIAGGYEELGRPADAASRYEEAAEKVALEGEQDELRARAARAYAAAGNKARAIQIWEQLEAKGGPLVNEAKVRLGELRATPAGPTG
jgi:predicted negative regulator of RcsB-dependent stress response